MGTLKLRLSRGGERLRRYMSGDRQLCDARLGRVG
jgi:hypothetical protein